MTGRVGHRKSRNGCQRCKKRRVKNAGATKAETRHRFPEAGECPALLRDIPGARRQLSHSPHSLIPPKHLEPDHSDSWISDVELTHHYATVAYGTFSPAPEVCHALQFDVMRDALSHPYLLHGLLAFSGFHLAYLNPDDRDRYFLQASQHQKMAAKKMREALANMSPENCHALFVTSIFLIINAFAESSNSGDSSNHFSPIKAVVDIFSLVTGITLIFNSSGLDLHSGPLKGLFTGTGSGSDLSRLRSLLDQLSEIQSQIHNAKDLDETEKRVVIASIDALKNGIDTMGQNKATTTPAEVRALFVWPAMLPRDFIDLARADHPVALILLAHYSVILHWAEPECWFLKSWAGRLIGNIIQKLAGSPWSSYIVWPVRCIHSG
ncbi:hypothetical protein NM208_g172 [Fusarium decemcellulare]|uniref:Uncharacterized protein n=1 Tax=Fusarium decemcellulare TaxID=57161 RepID=A0ACC1T0I9_9HYPO|nr:hypothetical protein NM208_g172 [Fusarium decemcellulare]